MGVIWKVPLRCSSVGDSLPWQEIAVRGRITRSSMVTTIDSLFMQFSSGISFPPNFSITGLKLMYALFPFSQSLPKIIGLQRVVATYVCIVTTSPTITGRHIIPDIFISRPSACTTLKSAGFKSLHLNPKSNKSFCLIIDMDAPVSNNALTFFFTISTSQIISVSWPNNP